MSIFGVDYPTPDGSAVRDYIHVSDNPGDRVEHLEPGKGAINWDVFFETIDRVGYEGHFGVDIGGHESRVDDLDQAYRTGAHWLEERIGG